MPKLALRCVSFASMALIACAGSSGTNQDPLTSGGAGGNGGGSAGLGGMSGASGGTAGLGGAGASGNSGGSGGSAGVMSAGGSGGGMPSGGMGGMSSGGLGGEVSDAGEPPTGTWPSVTSLTGDGPYTVVTNEASGPGGGYTLHHPEQLGPEGLEHPILTWGNGATTVPALFPLLAHLASHGFVVIASNNAFVTGEELRAGLDWLEQQNADASSVFYQKLDTDNAASFGYSLGSLGTFEIADDPRLQTTVHISGGAMDKAVLPNLKHPAAFFCGDPSDIANANCESDFEVATVPVFYGVFPGDHLGILGAFEGSIREATTGWLRWRLMHDDTYESMFVGPSCSLCMDPDWTVKQKDFDTVP